ncbi:MAG TPA: rod shape-determining protein RodA [Chloroflexota bacterium]|nr:rod shape-determining protein RodA [Chloroflexota bacterium]
MTYRRRWSAGAPGGSEVKHWANFDIQLVGLPVALVAFGSIVLFAISRWPTSGVTLSTPIHQALYAVLGLAAMVILTNFDYRLLRSLAVPLFALNMLILLVVLGLGHSAYGAQRWINVGILPLQPSEPAKLMLVIVLAKFFADREDRGVSGRAMLGSLLWVVAPMALVLLQPDLGTSAVFVAIWVGIALMAGVQLSHLAALAAGCGAILPVLWNAMGHVQRFRYMQDRLTIFLNPNKDPLGEGYNVIHSLITVGAGGFLGQHFAPGTQSQLGFQRVEDKDFIFSVIAEQVGFAGVLVLFAAYTMLLLRIARVSFMAGDIFGRLLASGILAMLMFQIFVNIGMNVGMMPVTGIPLPLLSYGGSSLITTLASLGILQSILLRHQKLVFAAG